MTMITPSYLGETIEYSSLHACRSTLEDPTEFDCRDRIRRSHLEISRGASRPLLRARPRLGTCQSSSFHLRLAGACARISLACRLDTARTARVRAAARGAFVPCLHPAIVRPALPMDPHSTLRPSLRRTALVLVARFQIFKSQTCPERTSRCITLVLIRARSSQRRSFRESRSNPAVGNEYMPDGCSRRSLRILRALCG